MKTRQELILEFMLALASNLSIDPLQPAAAEWVYLVAAALTDEYLKETV